VKVHLCDGPAGLNGLDIEIPRYDSVIHVRPPIGAVDTPTVRYNVVYEKVGTALRPARRHGLIKYTSGIGDW